MIEKEELETLTSLDNDEEKVAREMGLLKPLDVLMIFLYLWKGKLWDEKHEEATIFSSDEFYRQLEDNYGMRKEKAEEAVYRLKSFLISFAGTPQANVKSEISSITTAPAPITEYSPIVTLGGIVAPRHIHAPSFILTGPSRLGLKWYSDIIGSI